MNDRWLGLTRFDIPRGLPEIPAKNMAMTGQALVESLDMVYSIANETQVDGIVPTRNPFHTLWRFETPTWCFIGDPGDVEVIDVYEDHCDVKFGESYKSIYRRIYKTPSELAYAQKVDCHGIIYTLDDQGVPGLWATKRAMDALIHRINWVDPKFMSQAYVHNLCKLKAFYGFKIGLPGFDKDLVDRRAIDAVFEAILEHGALGYHESSYAGTQAEAVAKMLKGMVPHLRKGIVPLVHAMAKMAPYGSITHLDVLRNMFPFALGRSELQHNLNTHLILGHLYGFYDPDIAPDHDFSPIKTSEPWIYNDEIHDSSLSLEDIYCGSHLLSK